jgi:heme-degrading monooxygenase HmoA
MYVRLNMFSLASGQRATFEQLVDRFVPIFRAQQGFQSITVFEADAVTGVYGSFSLWDICEDADAADAALMP